jgi:predicted DNA-binding transcriptional regulator AlpA
MRARDTDEPASTPATGLLVLNTYRLGEVLGLSERTIRRLDSAGKLPRAIKLGGTKVYRADEVRAWVTAGCPDRARWEQMNKTQ